MTDVAERLLTSKMPAVQALVGNARRKRLCNLLAAHRREILVPSYEARMRAAVWAADAELVAVPSKTFAKTFTPAERLGSPFLCAAVMLAQTVRDWADTLPPEAQKAAQRILQQYQANLDADRQEP
jgi:hypothetical protein